MLNGKNFNLQECIYQGNLSLIYKAYIDVDNSPILIKSLKEDYVGESELNRYQNEYKLLQNIDSPFIRKSLDLLNQGRTLILEYIPFSSLKKVLEESQKLSILQFLSLAIPMSKALADIHKNAIIHKDINPNNFLVELATATIKLIDFGISTQLPRQMQQLANPDQLEGTLLYLSPEQTGRMNRAIDYRTDFYSLGITFYEMLAGQVPFNIEEPLQLIHSHITVQPIPLHQLNPEIPKAISAIVAKLLSKNAEDRYQSAAGIVADLENCYQQYLVKNEIEDFEIGLNDVSDRFHLSQKLYGREKDLEVLLKAFEALNQGNSELVLVGGQSGIGKSALINELHKSIAEKQGYFISGKFDQLKQNIPYTALVEAFTDLIRQLLTEPETLIQTWKKKLLKALGNNGQIMIDLIPELELLIGKQPPLPDLDAIKAQDRFKYTFEQFVSVFTNDYPLTIFLDDLQWADRATISLLETMLKSSAFSYLFIIGAYRDNEIDAAHPLQAMIYHIEKEKSIHFIKPSLLTLPAVTALISDTLKTDQENVFSLATLVYEKTQGNPFFVNEFLKNLYIEESIYFAYEKKKWEWDVEKIRQLNITDNVVTLLLNKIYKLSSIHQEILFLAACLGNSFKFEDLIAIAPYTSVELKEHIQELLKDGLWQEVGKKYKFVHDKVQQAAYLLVEEDKKIQIHYQLLKNFQEKLSIQEQAEYVFELINHGNKATSLMNASERLQLAEMNLLAGNKAKDASAHIPALLYLESALSLCALDSWQTHYEFTLNLHNSIAETYFINEKPEKADQHIEIVIKNAKTYIDKGFILRLKILKLISEYKLREAINLAADILKKLGVYFPKKGSKFQIIKELIKTRRSLKKDWDNLQNIKINQSKDVNLAMDVLILISSCAYFIDPLLLLITAFKLVNLSFKSGFSKFSSYGFTFLIPVFYGIHKQIANKIRDFSINLISFFDDKQLGGMSTFGRNLLTNHWYIPVKDMVKESAGRIYQDALEIGNTDLVAYTISMVAAYDFCAQKNLNEYLKNFENIYIPTLHRTNRKLGIKHIEPTLQIVENLTNIQAKRHILTGKYFDETEGITFFHTQDSKNGLRNYYHYKLTACYFFQEYLQGYEAALESLKYMQGRTVQLQTIVFYFYYSLTLAAVYNINQDKKVLKNLQKNIKKMEKWANNAPFNFKHKYFLLQAEYYNQVNDVAKALDFYNQAIITAKENGFIADEALGYELAAYFFLKIDNLFTATNYFQKAILLYNHWGAHGKVVHMKEKFPYLYHQDIASSNYNTVKHTINVQKTSHILSYSHDLDLSTILKASQTLSGEVYLGGLLEKMLLLLMENAGAQRGFILQYMDNMLLIQAEQDKDYKKVLHKELLENRRNDVGSALIEYVARTKQILLLDNASEEGKFTKNAYIQHNNIKSVLCLPVLHQGNLLAILYLENNLIAGAFFSKQVELITVLSSQLAISLENAINYENLEIKVQKRTLELKEKNDRITDSIQYAKRIQAAILPSDETFKEVFPEYFALFKPRDIVSGDFYWLNRQENKILLALVDSTGHGVPGAFMSMIGTSLLNEILNKHVTIIPNKILEELHIRVTHALKQSENTNQDGMDMAVCLLEELPNNQVKITFSGAKRPLYIVENNQLKELKSDRNSIGGGKIEKLLFTNQEIVLPKGATLYLSTDGFADQASFNRSKYTSLRLKTFLALHSHLTMQEQHQLLLEELQNHMQGTEQRDDITLLGIKL